MIGDDDVSVMAWYLHLVTAGGRPAGFFVARSLGFPTVGVKTVLLLVFHPVLIDLLEFDIGDESFFLQGEQG